MKKILAIYIIFIALGVIIFGACTNEPISSERVGKDSEIKVDYLFEKDGVKVYRFIDGGRVHYFTTNGEAISTQTEGKHTYTENIKNY
jgi:hypothetical protein